MEAELLRRIGICIVLSSVILFLGCNLWAKTDIGYVGVECPECDMDEDPRTSTQCMTPCMKKCLEDDMGASRMLKVVNETDATCTCTCSSDATDALNLAKAVREKDESYCEKTPLGEDGEHRYLCYTAVAAEKSQEGLCEKIPSDAIDMRDNCYWYVATKTENATICEKISGANYGMRAECYFQIADKTDDPALCERIFYPEDRERCLELLE